MKLFHKIAVTTLGLAMATAVGIGIARYNRSNVKMAKAADVSLLSFSRSGTTDTTTAGATFTKAASGQTGYYQDGNNDPAYLQLKVNSALTIPNDATALTLTARLGAGANRDISDKPVHAALLNSDGSIITGTDQTLCSNITVKAGADFEIDYTSFKSSNIYGVKIWHEKIESYNVRYYTFNLYYTSASSVATIELNKNEINLGIGTTDTVDVSFQDLTDNISVAQSSANGGSLNIDSSISKDESSPFSFELQGATAGDVTVSFTSGTAQADLTVHVQNTTEYALVENTESLTPGSTFIIVGNNGTDKTAVLTSTLSSGYFAGGLVSLSGTSARTIYENVLTLVSTNSGMAIMSGSKYIGATKLDATGLTTNTDISKIAYPYWNCTIDSTTHVARIVLDTDASGNNKLLNFNQGYNRFGNYSISNEALTYIYSANLAPAIYPDDDSVEVNASNTIDVEFSSINFGGETVSYSAESANTSVATVSVNNNVLTITGVAAGQTTVSVEATSANHGPANCEISVKVNNAARVLQSLTLSVLNDSLYVGQEFSYSGVVTANYSDSSSDVISHDQLTFTGYNMATEGEQQVTVSYTDNAVEAHETYTLTVSEYSGALKVGSYYVLASVFTKNEVNYKFAMTGIAGTASKPIGEASSYDSTLRSESAFIVEKGATYNSYSFKLGNGDYLSAVNDNYLKPIDEKNEASSWTVEENGDDYVITNVQVSDRTIRYNDSNPRFAAYKSGQQPVTLFEVEYTDIVSHFVTNFMHTEISIDNNEDTGACRDDGNNPGYYTLAATAFNKMPQAARDFFIESPMYANYEARLEAWASANGQELSNENLFVDSASNLTITISDNNKTFVIIVTSAIATISLAGVFFMLRKRKRQ